MAARNRPGLSEKTRDRIKTTMLVKRLEDHILGKVELSTSQVRGIEVLLNRTLPVLQSIEHTGEQQTGLSELLQLASKQAAALEKAGQYAKAQEKQEVKQDVEAELLTKADLAQPAATFESKPNTIN